MTTRATIKQRYSSHTGEKEALELFKAVAENVPAYKDFLKRHNIDPSAITTSEDFKQLPYIDKANYITQYPLKDLCWQGDLRGLNYIVSSSGSTGVPFYWPRGDRQDQLSKALYQSVFETSFDLDDKPTLVVNSYGQGTWIAGTELYNTVRLLGQDYPHLSIVNTGIDIDLCITQLEQIGGNFEKVIICGYPPLLRDLIERGVVRGLPWDQLNVYLITAGEAMSEPWRHYIQDIIGSEHNRVINVYGLADAGVVAAETPLTLSLRRHYNNELPEFLGGHRTTGLHQYYPDMRYFESDEEYRLLLTTASGLPLVRYDTKDHGIIMSATELMQTLGESSAGIENGSATAPPVLALFGREDLSTTLYAVNIYPENIRPALDSLATSSRLTGRFVMHTKHHADMRQYLVVEIELAEGVQPDTEFKKQLQQLIVEYLRATNTEYRELYAKIAGRAVPQIQLKPYNSIGYIAGKKHQWVKRG